MERIKALNRYQKAILLAAALLAVVFTVLYPLTLSRVGYAYQDTIFVPRAENGGIVYEGKLQREAARFTVSADKTVVFQYGDKTYGPFTAQEDPDAIPQDNELAAYMTGVSLYCGDDLLFRGGVLRQSDLLLLFQADGSLFDFGITTTANGIMVDENGTPIDQMQPSASVILELMDNPQLTHKGTWLAWGSGIFFCLIAVVTVLFADELFRLELSFHIRNVEEAEPSDWEITTRYISWVTLLILALVLFIIGLQ